MTYFFENWSLTWARFSTTRKSSVRPLSTGGTNVGADPDPDKRNKQTKKQTDKWTNNQTNRGTVRLSNYAFLGYRYFNSDFWNNKTKLERTIFNHSVHALKVPTFGKVNCQGNKVWFSKSLESLPFTTAQMNARLDNKISNFAIKFEVKYSLWLIDCIQNLQYWSIHPHRECWLVKDISCLTILSKISIPYFGRST